MFLVHLQEISISQRTPLRRSPPPSPMMRKSPRGGNLLELSLMRRSPGDLQSEEISMMKRPSAWRDLHDMKDAEIWNYFALMQTWKIFCNFSDTLILVKAMGHRRSFLNPFRRPSQGSSPRLHQLTAGGSPRVPLRFHAAAEHRAILRCGSATGVPKL